MFYPVSGSHPIKKAAAKQLPSHPVSSQVLELAGLLFPLFGLVAARIAVVKKSPHILLIAKGIAIAGCIWSFGQLADEIING